MTDLDIIYNYYKDRKKYLSLKEFPKYDEQGNLNTIYEDVFGFLIDFYNKNAFPNVVSDSVYDSIDKKEVYRGFKDNEHIGNMLCHYNYHYGSGVVQGMFFSNFKEEALAYTRTGSNISADENKVLKAKIVSDNCMNLFDLLEFRKDNIEQINNPIDPIFIQKKNELRDFYQKIRKYGLEDANEFYNIMKRPGVFAVYLGLDYLYRENAKHFIVLNRNIVAIKESEFKKMCEMTTHYKDGCFDFYNLSHENNEK